VHTLVYSSGVYCNQFDGRRFNLGGWLHFPLKLQAFPRAM
jgi:hypothetical protein